MDSERVQIVKRFNDVVGIPATDAWFQRYNVEFGCKPIDILEGEDYTRLYNVLFYLESGMPG